MAGEKTWNGSAVSVRTAVRDTFKVSYLEQLSCSLWSLADCFEVAAYSCIPFAASPAGEGSVTSVARHRGIGLQVFVVAGGRRQNGGKMRACRSWREKLRRSTWRTLRPLSARVLIQSFRGGRRWPLNIRRDRGGMHQFRLDIATEDKEEEALCSTTAVLCR